MAVRKSRNAKAAQGSHQDAQATEARKGKGLFARKKATQKDPDAKREQIEQNLAAITPENAFDDLAPFEMEPPKDPGQTVLAPLRRRMEVDLVISDDERVWLLHDKPLDGPLRWVEYDADDHTLSLVYRNGSVAPLGTRIAKNVRRKMNKGTKIYVVCLMDETIVDFYDLSLVVRQTGL